LQLISAGHWGPFEHPTITFGIEGMSRVTLAQLTRHRLASFDIQSGRYVSLRTLTPQAFVWPPSFRDEAVVSRETGRKEITLSSGDREKLIEDLFSRMIEAYKQLVDGGVPKEDARYLFPLATPVNGTMTVNARSLMHIIAIRSFGDAQWEIRDLVRQMLEIGKTWMPVTFEAFEKRMKSRDVIAP
ncbi:MAG: FAD-dependent thymidylate synthase, partial [Thermoplasmata archaeon]|nr:FAD-dependent thymidylate synthase [Thermoplasmata archaeon]